MNEMTPLDGGDAEIEQAAAPLFTAVMQAHGESDYALLESVMAETMKAALPKAVFDGTLDQHIKVLGPLTSQRYLGCLYKGSSTHALWKTRYEHCEVDVLWQLSLARDSETGEVKVTGMAFS